MKRDQSEHLFLMLLFLRSSASERFLVVGPAAPVVVSPGEDAVLPCSLSPSISAVNLEIRWFREDYNDHVCLYQNHMYVPQSTDSSYNGRADLFLQKISEGNVSLNLRAVIPSDDGPYKCMVVSSPYYEEAVINVRVTALGSQPSVSLHSPGGGQTQLLCRSEGWFPAPAVIWTDRDGHDVTSLSRTTVDRDSQGFLSVSSYIPVQQESNIFSCLVRSALPKPDWRSQLHIPRDFFPGPSGWMVALCVTAALTVAASALLVIQWRRMDNEEIQTTWKAIPVILTELDAVKNAPLPKSEWQWLCSAAADVTLDPDTAHPELSLSEDGKRVRVGEEQDLPDNPERFDYTWCVLSRDGLACGRHYWEVEGNEDWRIGVSRESAQRKGRFDFTPKGGYWGLECNSSPDSFQLSALTDPATDLPLSLRPRRLGVCVDIEERKVSFYIVESRTHIFTFTDMEFSQGEKIYPFLYTWDSDKDLVLLPPVHCGD
ncbi:butyrophilin subfamily 1 member A1-like isoform X1 [Lepisosteus oculatus]|uniref:butyrophilin subfamily 1 member A1-like isoform X1 n=1 Tax=Lepisosteus oculatus TaxID=7918 RepID=UPI00371C6002